MSDSNQIKDPTFLQLKLLSEQFSELHLNDLFDQDNLRFEQLSTQFEQLVFDYSKQRLQQPVMDVLLQFTISKQLNRCDWRQNQCSFLVFWKRQWH